MSANKIIKSAGVLLALGVGIINNTAEAGSYRNVDGSRLNQSYSQSSMMRGWGIQQSSSEEDMTPVEMIKHSCSKEYKAVSLLESLQTGDVGPIEFINPDNYIQHNQSAADGVEGLVQLMSFLPEGATEVNISRVFKDGNYVFTHTEYLLFGQRQIGFDVFRFEDGKIVEHWDNLQNIVAETASGRTQIDGPTKVEDHYLTRRNKKIITSFMNDYLLGGNPEANVTDYISTEKYYQHNPLVGDGLAAFGEVAHEWEEAGTPMIYTENHMILGQGNFVMTASEGEFLGDHVAFYDLFRLENGKVVEHWDAIQKILPDSESANTNGKF